MPFTLKVIMSYLKTVVKYKREISISKFSKGAYRRTSQVFYSIGSNVVSVAEDELMRVLILVRNFLPGHRQVINGDWNVAGIAYRSYDLEGKTVGTVGAGRIGRLLLQRYVHLHAQDW